MNQTHVLAVEVVLVAPHVKGVKTLFNVTIFNKEIQVRDHYCQLDNSKPSQIDEEPKEPFNFKSLFDEKGNFKKTL